MKCFYEWNLQINIFLSVEKDDMKTEWLRMHENWNGAKEKMGIESK